MSAILRLTQEELDVVRYGAIEEPRYRPWPSRQRAFEAREEEEADREGREPRELEDPPTATFTRMVSAQYWRRHGTTLVYLLTAQSDAEAPSSVVALARAAGAARIGVGDGSRNLKIGPWHVLNDPIPLADIELGLDDRHREWLQVRISGRFRPLQPTLANAVDQAVEQMVPNYRQVAADLVRPAVTRRRRELLERRDATATALAMLTPQWRSLRPVDDPQTTTLAYEVDEVLTRVSENDVITDDSDVFEDWARVGRSNRGWREFRHGQRRMLIKNINFNREEHATGADLVYVRTEPDAVVLVQYKMLSQRSDGRPFLRSDDRLQGQLDRMLSYASPRKPEGSTSTDDYRLGEAFAFLKLVSQPGAAGLEDTELTQGWYLTAEYVRARLANGAAGPRAGRSIDFESERAINSSTFTDLVRKAWVGSTTDVHQILIEVLQPRTSSMTVALDQPRPPELT